MSDAQPARVVIDDDTEPPQPNSLRDQRAQQDGAAVGQLGIPPHPIDNQDGGDVEMSAMINQLHDETVAVLAVQPPYVDTVVPRFYFTSVYYLYKLALKRGLRPVQLYRLADTVKVSIQQACPHLDVPDFPSLQNVVETLQHFEAGRRESAQEQMNAAFTEFACVFMNYMAFAKRLYDRDGRPPRYLHFLHQFCILFGKFNSGNVETKYQWRICELLRPMFPLLASTHFNNLYATINNFIENLDLHVTFTPRSF